MLIKLTARTHHADPKMLVDKWVNVDKIVSFHEQMDTVSLDKYTRVVVEGDYVQYVKETPDEIISLLRKVGHET